MSGNKEWEIFEPCPYCGGKTYWVFINYEKKSEKGCFKCKHCGERSGFMKFEIKQSNEEKNQA